MNAPTPSRPSLDYHACRYGGVRIAFRGPQKKPNGRYITFLGGTETFGPLLPQPYPDMVEAQTGLTCVNLGCRKGGVDAYLAHPSLLELCGAGAATVIEVTGAQHMSNRFYTVDPRRNNRFLRASKLMKSIFFEFDFSGIETADQIVATIARDAPERLAVLRKEIQTSWVARMRQLLRAIKGPKILLWAADHAPYSAATGGTIARNPLFIDRAMLNAVAEADHRLVEVVFSRDEAVAGFERMPLEPQDIEAAAGMLGPVAHRRIADELAPLLDDLAGAAADPFDETVFGEAEEPVNLFASCDAG